MHDVSPESISLKGQTLMKYIIDTEFVDTPEYSELISR